MVIGVNLLAVQHKNAVRELAYLRHLLTTLRRLDTSKQIVLFTDAAAPVEFPGCSEFPVDFARAAWGGPERRLREAIGRAGVDVLLTPLDEKPPKTSARMVFYTFGIEDAQHWAAESSWRARRALRLFRQRALGAAGIVVPSDFLRRQCHEILNVPLDKLFIVRPGVDAAFTANAPRMVEGPYLLFVGGTESSNHRKHLLTALQAIEKRVPHHAVVVGPPGPGETHDWGPKVIRIEHCPERQLAALYQHCAAYVCHENSGPSYLGRAQASYLCHFHHSRVAQRP